jgi:hypothetical protein
MSEQLTGIRSPYGHGIGLFGQKTREEMVQQYRLHYENKLKNAQEALAYQDEQLITETYAR